MPQLMPRSFIPDDDDEEISNISMPKSFIPDEQEEEEQQPNILRRAASAEVEALVAAKDFVVSQFNQKDKPKSFEPEAKTVSKADTKLAEDVEKGFKKGVLDPKALKEFINSIASSRPEIENKPESLAERFVSSRTPAYLEEPSVLDSEMTKINRSLESVANPKALSDFMALVIPNITGAGSSAINKLLKKAPIPEELPIKRGRPQEDTVAIALTRDYPRTSQNISAETGIPKASVRRVLSDRRKKGLSSLEIQPTATEVPPIKQTQAAVSELDEFIKNNPEAKMSEIENFINKTEIPKTSSAPPKSFVPDAPVVEQPKKQNFLDLADAQRGKPESAMLDVQEAMGGGVLNPVVENIGDLTHRMNERNTFDSAGYEFVKDKVEKALRQLTHSYGFEKEFSENILSNAKYKGIDPNQFRNNIDNALNNYSKAHANLPAYNEAHQLARDAAVKIGQKDFAGAIDNLNQLKAHLGNKEEWIKFARKNMSGDIISHAPVNNPPKKPFVNPFEKPKAEVPVVETLNKEDNILDFDPIEVKVKKFESEIDPEIIKDNYNNALVEFEWQKIHGNADGIEEAGILHDSALDRLNQLQGKAKIVEDDIIELHGGIGSVGRGKKKKPIPISGPYGPALDKLFKSMGGVMENRVQQDVINKVERAKRFAAFKGVKDEGMSGASKSLSKLKGEFEKVVPEKLLMQQEEIDTLFTAVKRARITEGEKARGYTALFKLMNGDKLPQRNELRILDDVFGNGFAERIINLHGGLGAINMKIGKVGNTMKAMMSSGDLSMSLRQGVGFAHRPEWRNAVKEQLKYLAQPEYFKAAMDAIEERPKYLLGRESGLFLAKPGGLMNGEEMFMNNYVENIPGVRNVVEASERAYVGGLNKLRSDVFDNLTDLAEKSGVKITNVTDYVDTSDLKALNQLKKEAKELGIVADLDEKLIKNPNFIELAKKRGLTKELVTPTKESENIAKYVNLFTGRGSLGKLEPIAGVLNTLFWSPKYRASRLQINPIFNPKFYIDLDPFTRKQAAKSLLAMASASLTFNTLATLSGATVGYNLLSSDFMKSRFKRTDNVMDPNAGMQQPVVAAARMINELNRMGSGKPRKFGERNIGEIGFDYLRSGASPIVGLADELITMRKYEGDKKDASLKTFGMPQYGGYTDKYGNKKYLNTELAKRFTSIFSQDIYEIIESDPSFEEGIGLATGSLLGIGEQRYPERKPSNSHLRRMRLNP